MNNFETLTTLLNDEGVVYETEDLEEYKSVTISAFPDDDAPKNKGYVGFINIIIFNKDGSLKEWGIWE